MVREAARRRFVGALLAAALVAAARLGAASDAPAAEGPPAPAGKTALVLPTRVPQAQAENRATLDLVVATALQELGFTVVDAGQAAKELQESSPDLVQARELYLDLHFEAALEAARVVRAAHLVHRGDLLGDPMLTEAELMMIRVLLDMGEQLEARELALEVLEREPDLRLDPVDSPPAMQALWVAALERRAAMQPREHDMDALAAVGTAAGAAFAVAAIAKRTPDGVDWLVVQIVPTRGTDKPSRHPVALGTRGTWARDVRRELEQRFGPPPSEAAAAPEVPAAPGPTDEKKKVWYKSWWFWTGVGLVVVGGAVAGIAVALDDADSTGSISMDPQ